MRIVSGANPAIIRVPLYGAAADIADGAAVMPGTTAETNLGTFIVATNTAAGVDILGFLRGIHDYSEVGDTAVAGTKWVWGEVELCDAYKPVWIEYDQTDKLSFDGGASSTTVTITDLEDNIDTSWLYAVSGTGEGVLSYITTSGSGSCTTLSASGYSTDTYGIKIFRIGHQLGVLNTEGDMMSTTAAVGTWTIVVLENWFEDYSKGYGLQQLDPTKHDNLTLPNARFYSKILVRNTAGHTVD
jgi:hypothetical protein